MDLDNPTDRQLRVAWLGLGRMGLPMARRLAAAGHRLTVWNRTPERAAAVAGATVAGTPAEAVAEADVVMTMLADPAAVRDVLSAAAPALRPGTVLVDLSTIGPEGLRDLAALLPEGVTLVDAPVMGSVDRAAAGELLVLTGGDPGPAAPLLERLGTVVRCGLPGSAAAVKIVLINAVIGGVVVVAEALALADSLKLPEGLAERLLAQGPLGPLYARATDTTSDFALSLAAKDVALATSLAQLPLSEQVLATLRNHPQLARTDLARLTDALRAERR